MLKSDFEKAIRTELRKIPIEERRTWDDTKLFFWYMEAKSTNPFLVWDKCPGDPWQCVPSICKYLIGPGA